MRPKLRAESSTVLCIRWSAAWREPLNACGNPPRSIVWAAARACSAQRVLAGHQQSEPLPWVLLLCPPSPACQLQGIPPHQANLPDRRHRCLLTLSPSPTTNLAICLMLITYLASSVLGLMILVQRATWGSGSAGAGP